MSVRTFRLLCSILTVSFLLSPVSALANVAVSPFIIDETVDARDLFDRNITIINEGGQPTRVFASVHEITLDEGGGIETFVPASMSDNRTSVTSWLSIDRRRIELPPGASTSRSVGVHIQPSAVPGVYHALIGFGSGSSRDEAEQQVMAGTAPGVIIRITVRDSRVSELQLTRFTADRVLIESDPEAMVFAVTNAGDLPLAPTGEIILYNTSGEEVASVPVNSSGRIVAPGETTEFAASVETGGLFGKYKAFLNLKYGDGRAAVHDTTFFYVAPLPYVAALFFGLFVFCFAMVFWWRRSLVPYTGDDDDAHRVPFYVKTGTATKDYDHDINLSTRNETPTS